MGDFFFPVLAGPAVVFEPPMSMHITCTHAHPYVNMWQVGNLIVGKEDTLFGLDTDPGREISRDTVSTDKGTEVTGGYWRLLAVTGGYWR